MDLVKLNIEDFIQKLASDSPTPGGGSVSALAGALSAALCAMVARLTVGREKYAAVWEDMEKLRDRADQLSRLLLELVDRDTEAYIQVMMALRLPKENDEQMVIRKKALDTANKQAALVPLETLRTVERIINCVVEALVKGNPNCMTDAGVAAQLIRAAAIGAAYNVRINLSGISDVDFTNGTRSEITQLLTIIKEKVIDLEDMIEQRF